MMRAFGKEVGHGFVRLIHEVVYNEQYGLPAVEILQVWQTLMERHSWVLIKQLLHTSIPFAGGGFHHDARILGQLKQEARLSRVRHTRH